VRLPAKRSKFGAVPTVVDGIRFDSKKEARRYQELKMLERAGEIRHLSIQPRYELRVGTHDVGSYVGDFRYEEHVNQITPNLAPVWMCVVEDCKGVRTPVYRLKKKLMKALYGIDIRET
jgi:hypothetical protein